MGVEITIPIDDLKVKTIAMWLIEHKKAGPEGAPLISCRSCAG